VGEQYVALIPRSGNGAPLKDGDVVPLARTSVPPDINSLLDAANRALQAIPQANVKTVVDESYTAFGGLGPEIARLVKGSTQLAIDARANLEPLTVLIDRSGPVLDAQAESATSIEAWADHVADLTRQLSTRDAAVAGVLEKGPAAAEAGRQLFDRLQATIPVLMANLSSLGRVTLVYNPAIEQILVLLPQAMAGIQTTTVANRGTKHPGLYMDFNLNFNLPPPCTTGYLPAQQWRSPALTDVPERTTDDMYCRIPQDAPNAVRGARNFPCLAQPGKRAPTAAMCESDEQYVPLNDGNNWKGDPNATLTGQDIPAPHKLAPTPPPAAPLPSGLAPPVSVAYYDPVKGAYMGPDGKQYIQSDLAQGEKDRSWQSMLIPRAGN
jgi:phospholipid/cholesterol/gamma-HCH transport system substrate-binding protein